MWMEGGELDRDDGGASAGSGVWMGENSSRFCGAAQFCDHSVKPARAMLYAGTHRAAPVRRSKWKRC